MLWTDILEKFKNGDLEIIHNDGLHVRGPLTANDAMEFNQRGFLFRFNLEWTKILTGEQQWIDHKPMALEFDTTLTRIRETGGNRICINLVIKKPPIPPSKTDQLLTIGNIIVHPADDQTARWHASVSPPVLALVVK
jgi:hypothetical protein